MDIDEKVAATLFNFRRNKIGFAVRIMVLDLTIAIAKGKLEDKAFKHSRTHSRTTGTQTLVGTRMLSMRGVGSLCASINRRNTFRILRRS